MWPFSSKVDEEAEKKVRQLGEVGDHFKYLGIDCVIMGHWIAGSFPGVQYEYVNRCGNIKSGYFLAYQLDKIIEENSNG